MFEFQLPFDLFASSVIYSASLIYFVLRHYRPTFLLFFFFNDTATTEIYTLSLHDALPIFPGMGPAHHAAARRTAPRGPRRGAAAPPPGRARGPHQRSLEAGARTGRRHGEIGRAHV